MNTGKIPFSSLKCKIFLLLGCPGFSIFMAETSPKIKDDYLHKASLHIDYFSK
jgi:hypothetical protein